MSINSPERVRAEAKYRKLQRASENANAGAEYQAEREQLKEKTSRLKSLRLAQAAEEGAGAEGDAATARPDRRVAETGEPGHKFSIGEIVNFAAQPRTSAAHGHYEITGLLPAREQPQYRIKSVLEGHERVAQEDQLSAR